MINRVSKSHFTSAAVVALFLLASGDFAAAQGPSSAPRRTVDSAGGIRPRKNPPQQVATDGSWNIDNSGVWSLATNWLSSNIADGAGATGNFLFNITATRTITIDTTSRTLGIMNIGDTNASNNYTIAASGGATLTFDNGGSNAQINETSTSGNNTISAPVVLNGSLNITNASANNLTLSGGITAGTAGTKTITTSTGTVTSSGVIGDGSGVVAVTQNGPGTLAFGTSANTYSGGTTLAGGKITIGGSGTGLGSGGLTLSGGTLVSSSSRSVAAATNVIVTADSALTTTSTAGTVTMPFSGTLTGTAGTLTIRNDAASTTGVFDARFSGGDYTMSRPIVVDNGAGGGTARLNDFNTTGTTHTYSGVISGNGGYNRSASVAGTGGLTVFTAANTYTGTTTVNQGTLQLGNGGTTGSLSTSSAINLSSSGGTFAINRSNSVTQGTDFSGAAITGAGSFVDIGTGTVTLNVANTYNGGTTLGSGPFAANARTHAPSGSAPFLIAAADGALGTGNVSLASIGVELTLTGGVTNNYISDNRTLSMVTGSLANLNFVGTDTISGLVLGGVAQAALGTYGSTASGAMHTFDNFFTGNGTLTLIPEPSTWAMTIVGAGLLLSVQRFRRKKT